MNFIATKHPVFNRGSASDSLLSEFVTWGKAAPEEIFAPNNNFDIYSKSKDELGPFNGRGPNYRRASMLEFMRVLILFESGGNWKEGTDSSRHTATTNENAEAGLFQESWDGRKLDPSLAKFLSDRGIADGITFQQRMKLDHAVAMEYAARLLRIDIKNFNRIANGPVRKGSERSATWPNRPKLWDEKESIYPWLRRDAVAEFEALLA